VRSALEEFEAAVERAHRDTGGGTGEHPLPPTPRATERNEPNDRSDRDHPDDRNDHGNDRDDHRNPSHHQNHLPEGAEQ
jgi:hypothetical protein